MSQRAHHEHDNGSKLCKLFKDAPRICGGARGWVDSQHGDSSGRWDRRERVFFIALAVDRFTLITD